MHQQLLLLNNPDRRATQEALVWFQDGILLIRRDWGGWALFSMAMIIFFSMVIIATSAILTVLPDKLMILVVDFLLPLVGALVALAVQVGTMRNLALVAKGETVQANEIFWLFGQLKRREIWLFILLVGILNIVYMSLEAHFITEEIFLELDGKPIINEETIVKIAVWRGVYGLATMLFTWAVVPMIAEFEGRGLLWLLSCNWRGTVRNLKGLVFISFLMFVFGFVIGITMILLMFIHGLLVLVMMVFLLLWLAPLIGAWVFSAYRHIFTDW